MTLSTLTLPKFIEFTSGGSPLAGGKVYFFEAGTSTPKDTFSDAAGASANANPVLLDSSGRATIFMNNDGLYKVRVDDSDDVTVYEVDQYGANFGVMLSNDPLLLADLDTNGFDIVTNTNKDLAITPHGTGITEIKNLTLATTLFTAGFAIVSESNADIDITPDGTGEINLTNASLATTMDTNGFAIVSVSNADIDLTPHGTGTVALGKTSVSGTLTQTGAADFADVVTGGQVDYNPQVGTTYTLTASDEGKVVTMTNASASTVTLPQQSTETLPEGFNCIIRQLGAGQVTVAVEGTDTLLSKGSAVKLDAQYSSVQVDIQTAGSPNTWFMAGDISA